ncbi:MAG: nuclear transport factor 2 family protein [Acidobacteria bacterium]|nr:nuclear transport factor 2 family protein [Acidobacteriota bacterium]
MALKDVANSLVDLCKQGKFEEAMNTHYADHIVSVEATGNEAMPAVMEGIEAVRGKTQWWVENHEVHSTDISGPFFNSNQPNQFCMYLKSDVTFKPTGERSTLSEVCLYDVEQGKVVREHFYYAV